MRFGTEVHVQEGRKVLHGKVTMKQGAMIRVKVLKSGRSLWLPTASILSEQQLKQISRRFWLGAAAIALSTASLCVVSYYAGYWQG